jgi:hypothetical protein
MLKCWSFVLVKLNFETSGSINGRWIDRGFDNILCRSVSEENFAGMCAFHFTFKFHLLRSARASPFLSAAGVSRLSSIPLDYPCLLFEIGFLAATCTHIDRSRSLYSLHGCRQQRRKAKRLLLCCLTHAYFVFENKFRMVVVPCLYIRSIVTSRTFTEFLQDQTSTHSMPKEKNYSNTLE